MSAEIRQPYGLRVNLTLASMGPRSDERGNEAQTLTWLLQAEASMGPRSDERGNALGPGRFAHPSESFNGAALR